jgi:hypothetical protein
MKRKITAILLSFFFILSSQTSLDAQSLKDRYFHSFGYIFEYVDRQVEYFSIGIQYEARINIANLSDNMAVSASAAPSFVYPFAADLSGNGAFNLPLLANLEIGAGSTYDSDADFGATFGVGLNYTVFPLFGDVGSGFERAQVSPLLRLSIRKFSSSGNHLREYFIQAWPFGSNDLIVRIGYSKFFGY